jgi:hypothetical protein
MRAVEAPSMHGSDLIEAQVAVVRERGGLSG